MYRVGANEKIRNNTAACASCLPVAPVYCARVQAVSGFKGDHVYAEVNEQFDDLFVAFVSLSELCDNNGAYNERPGACRILKRTPRSSCEERVAPQHIYQYRCVQRAYHALRVSVACRAQERIGRTVGVLGGFAPRIDRFADTRSPQHDRAIYLKNLKLHAGSEAQGLANALGDRNLSAFSESIFHTIKIDLNKYEVKSMYFWTNPR